MYVDKVGNLKRKVHYPKYQSSFYAYVFYILYIFYEQLNQCFDLFFLAYYLRIFQHAR